MRIARKLVLLTAMALAAMALAASTASAQDPIEVVNEATSEHCNPCAVTATGSSSLQAHFLGAEFQVSACTDSFTGEIYEDGTGHIATHSLTGPNCTRIPCDSAAESEWPISSSGETGTNTGVMVVRFCLEPNGGGTESHCNVNITITQNPATHEQVFSVSDQSCPTSPRSEVTGTWSTGAAGDQIEIVHL